VRGKQKKKKKKRLFWSAGVRLEYR